ncbi:hypothetical protein [Chitinophaga ginsengisoli]|uniref:Uncharacterized protein n=1 Tax=Chitinophaga ginsengisoli TaxID=363837 RepID=A0A2P8FTD8_9BACT|nr:hypothetical protein [Chitinophaga ginsengisoli]PSL24990.1 hypothetical protein CLV42_114139 [Chitinophaga ginsengisoli]
MLCTEQPQYIQALLYDAAPYGAVVDSIVPTARLPSANMLLG